MTTSTAAVRVEEIYNPPDTLEQNKPRLIEVRR